MFERTASSIWDQLQSPLNQIVIGPRGAGKTIALKRLDYRCDPSNIDVNQRIGLYVQVSKPANDFRYIFQQHEIRSKQRVQRALQFAFADYIWLEVLQKVGQFVKHVGLEESFSVDHIQRLTGGAFEALTIDDLCRQTDDIKLRILSELNRWSIELKCDWSAMSSPANSIDRVASVIDEAVPFQDTESRHLYLLFDESAPIPEPCQVVLNSFVKRGRRYCTKLAVRPFEWRTLQTLEGVKREVGTDLHLLFISYPDELTSAYQGQMRSIVQRLLKVRLNNHESSEGWPTSGEIGVDRLFPSFERICGISSGNPENLLAICSNIIAECQDSGTSFSRNNSMPTALEMRGINEWSASYVAQAFNPSVNRPLMRALTRMVLEEKDPSVIVRVQLDGESDLFESSNVSEAVGERLRHMFAVGFINCLPEHRDIFEIPRTFKLSRGLFPKYNVPWNVPCKMPPIGVTEGFIKQYSTEGFPRSITEQDTVELEGGMTIVASPSVSRELESAASSFRSDEMSAPLVVTRLSDSEPFLSPTRIGKQLSNSDMLLLEVGNFEISDSFLLGVNASQSEPTPVVCISTAEGNTELPSFTLEVLDHFPLVQGRALQKIPNQVIEAIVANRSTALRSVDAFHRVYQTNQPIRPPRKTPKTVYVESGKSACDLIRAVLGKKGWKVRTHDDVKSYGLSEVQVAILAAHIVTRAIVDTTNRLPEENLSLAYLMGVFAGIGAKLLVVDPLHNFRRLIPPISLITVIDSLTDEEVDKFI